MTSLERARDVTTSAADLRALASSEDRDVRLAVAANPSTPRELIEGLLGTGDDPHLQALIDAVLSNASLPLWLLDDPTWLYQQHLGVRARIPSSVARRMTRSPALSRHVWGVLSAHPMAAVRLAAMLSPAAPPQAWRLFGFATEPDALLGALAEFPGDDPDDVEMRKQLIDRFQAHPEVTARLRIDPDWLRFHEGPAVYWLAPWRDLTPALWDALRQHHEWCLRLSLLRLPVAPADAWTRLGLPTEGSWDLFNSGIEDVDLEYLARYPIVTGITHLNVGENYLHRDGLLALLHSPNFPRLVALDLSNVRRVAEVMPELARTTSFPELTELTLTGCDLPDASLAELARSSRHPLLRRLYIRGSVLTDGGASELARSGALHLTHLALSNDTDYAREFIGDAGAVALARSSSLDALTHLDLSWTRIGDAGALALTRAPFFPRLAELRLVGCPLSPAGSEALRTAAAVFPRLRLVLEREP